jgi:ABC-type sugar transport system, periplasmic component
MKNRLLAAILAILFLIAFSACGATKTPDNATNQSSATTATEEKTTEQAAKVDISGPFSKYDETVTFTEGIWKGDYSSLPKGDTADNNEFTRYIENRVNVKMKISWEVDYSAYAQKISLSIASGDIPDVLKVDEKTLKQLVDADLIQDLTKIYEQTVSPFLKEQYDSFNGRILPTATFDGKLMALPGCNIGGAHNMLWVRQDWLDKLKLQPPETLDDIVAIAKAFIAKDPDENGKSDTIGIPVDAKVAGVYNAFNGLDTIFSLYNAFPRQWVKDQSGNVIYGSVAPEMKTALAKIQELYKEGILDKQFAVRKQGEDTGAIIAAGKCGLVFGPWWGPYSPLGDSVKNNPKAVWKPYSAPLDTNGKLNVYTQNPNNMNLVIRKGYEHPEAVIKVLNVENEARRGLDANALDLITKNNGRAGIWPIDLQIDYEDAVYRYYKALKEAIDNNNPDKLRFDYKVSYEAYMKNKANPGADAGAWSEAVARVEGQALTFDEKVVRHDVIFFGQTSTMETKWATLDKLENETLLKIIMGEASIDQFDKFADQWKKLGGDQIMKEVGDSIKK